MQIKLLSVAVALCSLAWCGGSMSPSSPTSPTPTPTGSTSVSVSGINLMRKGVVWNMRGAQIIAFVAPPAAQTSYFKAAYAHYGTAELSALQAWGADTVRIQGRHLGLDRAGFQLHAYDTRQ